MGLIEAFPAAGLLNQLVWMENLIQLKCLCCADVRMSKSHRSYQIFPTICLTSLFILHSEAQWLQQWKKTQSCC